MSLDDSFILAKKKEVNRPPLYVLSSENIPLSRYQQFSVNDLFGERIVSYRKIKNPKEYDPERESPNPEYFDVWIFESENFLLFEDEGWGDGSTLHCFYYNGSNVRYTDRLFT